MARKRKQDTIEFTAKGKVMFKLFMHDITVAEAAAQLGMAPEQILAEMYDVTHGTWRE